GAGEFFVSLAPETIAENIAGGAYRYHVWEADGALAGVVCVRDNTHLYHLFVASGFHRRGIATALWEHARREAVRAGGPGRFTVNSSLYAVDVYVRMGFRAVGPAEAKKGVTTVPMVLEAGSPLIPW
ncbi:MAG TPA: GNAT family N-acetyltransferase, partial [Longimicrobium sp.]|nr:GNAT family N-acetyltransferase [Longimicrobium sp.]